MKMDEDGKLDEVMKLLRNDRKSNGEKAMNHSRAKQSNGTKVELDSTSNQSNKKRKEIDSGGDKSIEKKLGLNSSAQQANKKKKMKEVAVFGNYRNYYGYRMEQGMEEDPRLKVFKKEWFEGKDCLDIGCNSGLITITIAKKFGCRSIRGIDIDAVRIEDSYWTLRKIVNTYTKKSVNGNEGKNKDNPASEQKMEISDGDPSSSNTTSLFDIVSFQKENFVFNKNPSKDDKRYDTIICLSVTKWIQLNWGDEGLITLFYKVWRLLLPGGIFILEPQPWSSYTNNHKVSEVARQNYREIEIFPQDFQDILLDKIGFRKVEDLTAKLSCNKSGFKRPLLAFWK